MIVLDTSLIIARMLRESHPAVNDELYENLEESEILVPSHWASEIGNALWVNIRRGRIPVADLPVIAEYLLEFEPTVAPAPGPRDIVTLVTFAHDCGLTVYDATYLELALEQQALLATLDRDMRRVAQRLNVPLLPA